MRGGAKLAGHVVFAVLSALLSPELVPTPVGPKCQQTTGSTARDAEEAPPRCASPEELAVAVESAARSAALNAVWLGAVGGVGGAAAASLLLSWLCWLCRRTRSREVGVQTAYVVPDSDEDGGRLPKPRRRGRGVLTDA